VLDYFTVINRIAQPGSAHALGAERLIAQSSNRVDGFFRLWYEQPISFDFHHSSLLQPTLQLIHKVDLVLCCESMVKREEGLNPSLSRNCNRR